MERIINTYLLYTPNGIENEANISVYEKKLELLKSAGISAIVLEGLVDIKKNREFFTRKFVDE